MKTIFKLLFIFSLCIPYSISYADTHDDVTMEVIEHSDAERYEHEIELPGKSDYIDKEHHSQIDSDKEKNESRDDKDESYEKKESSHDGKDDARDNKEDSHDDKEDAHDDKEDSHDDKDDAYDETEDSHEDSEEAHEASEEDDASDS